MSREHSSATLLTIPVEIRLLVYEYLLLSRDRWAGFKVIETSLSKRIPCEPRSLHPAILLTCKQIYNEASSILYSENEWYIGKPPPYLKIFDHIGPNHMKQIKTVRILVETDDPTIRSGMWIAFLNALSREATGLRNLHLIRYVSQNLDTEEEEVHGHGPKERGDIEFVRALGTIKGLKTMVLEGYYGQKWPGYLEDKMGVFIHTRPGYRWNGSPQGWEMKRLALYQRGTDDAAL
jgi:hypothetical protein